MKYPRRPDQFKNRLERISDHCKSNSPMMRIPAIAKNECELVLSAYYGSMAKAGFRLLHQAFYLWRHDVCNSIRIGIADWAGWTKVYDVAETEEYQAHQQRHGRKCSGSPNCNNMHCIEDSIPRWYRWLTRWDK